MTTSPLESKNARQKNLSRTGNIADDTRYHRADFEYIYR